MRGKHKVRATIRREAKEMEQNIQTYQNAVVRLTKERDQIKEKLSATERALRKEIKVLKAQVSSGVAPEVSALEGEVRRQKQKVAEVTKLLEARTDQMLAMHHSFAKALVADGWGWEDASDFLMATAINMDYRTVVVREKTVSKVSKNASQVLQLERAINNKDFLFAPSRATNRRVDDPVWRERFAKAGEILDED